MITIIFSIFILVACFIVISKLIGEHFIDSLDNISDWLKLSPSVAGATLLAFGTSAPELGTTMFAVFLQGSSPAVGLGTVVGSAIFNILVVIGFATIVRTAYLDWRPVVRDGLFYVVCIVLLIVIVNDNVITTLESAAMIFTYFIYVIGLLFWNSHFKEVKFDLPEAIEDEVEEQTDIIKESKFSHLFHYVIRPFDLLFFPFPDVKKRKEYTIPVFIMSLGLIAFLTYFLVHAAENLSGELGIPTAIIALTVLAGGTSVPEVISSAFVAKQGRGDMAISNAIGSNSFDILMSIGLPVFIYTLLYGDLTNVGKENISSSIFLLFATVIAVIVLMIVQRFKVGKKFGYILIGIYLLYVIAAYTGIL